MPLIIYLDAQDYINIFNQEEGGPYHSTLSEILEFRDRGEVTIGFSWVTLLEFVTKPNDENRVERVRRGQLIKRICGPNAFPNLPDLIQGAKFPNGGNWATRGDRPMLSANDFRRHFVVSFKQKLLETGLNRAERRKRTRQLNFRAIQMELRKSSDPLEVDYKDFPVSNEIKQSRILERFVTGECSDVELETVLNAWATDPAEYSRIVYDYHGKPNMIDDLMGENLDRLVHAMDQLQSAQFEANEHNTKASEIRRNLFEGGLDKKEAKKLTPTVKAHGVDPSEFSRKMAKKFGRKYTQHFGVYMKRATKPNYNFKRSDGMDVLQMCYAYDCDLFRCDKDMANTFRDFEPFRGRLVSRFHDLPDRIRDKINEAE